MKGEKSVYVGIAGAIGFFTAAIISLIVICAPDKTWVAGPITVCMVLLGIMLGFFASKK
jgi:hypothetical protein